MERDFCKKCGKCCAKITVDYNKNIIFRDGIQPLTEIMKQLLIPVEEINGYTVCKCRYLDSNICTNPQKPEECILYPSSPFAFIPEDCGYEGYIFIENEKIKQHIRKLKEEIVSYTTLIGLLTDKSLKAQYEKIIVSHQAAIDKYKVYGSVDW